MKSGPFCEALGRRDVRQCAARIARAARNQVHLAAVQRQLVVWGVQQFLIVLHNVRVGLLVSPGQQFLGGRFTGGWTGHGRLFLVTKWDLKKKIVKICLRN